MNASTSSLQVFAALVLALTRFCQAMRVDPWPHLERLGVSAGDLEDPDGFVPYDALLVLWDELVATHPKVPLGMMYARVIAMADLGPIGLLSMHSPNLRSSLARGIRFQRLLDPLFDLDWQQADEHSTLVVRHSVEDTYPEPLEMMMSVMCMHVRHQLDDAVFRDVATRGGIEVRFKHAQRHSRADYESVFGPSIQFEQPHFSVRFPNSLLDLPFQLATPAVSVYLERALEEHERRRDTSQAMRERVSVEVERRLADGDVHQKDVARALGVSTRTMQRRLQAEGATFAEVLDEVRQSRACSLLHHTEHAVYEIACAVGYSEPSTFYRAFKRWTGTTPHGYREQSTGAKPLTG